MADEPEKPQEPERKVLSLATRDVFTPISAPEDSTKDGVIEVDLVLVELLKTLLARAEKGELVAMLAASFNKDKGDWEISIKGNRNRSVKESVYSMAGVLSVMKEVVWAYPDILEQMGTK